MLLGLGEPAGDVGVARLRPGPILVFALGRRIDDAGDMAGAGDDKAHIAAEAFRADHHRSGRCDVILAGGEIVDRDLHRLEIDQAVAEHHLALRQFVVEIAIAQIERMIGGRHPRGIGIPVQQIEREGRLALQIIVDDIGPDQVVGAQHVEHARHGAAFQIAVLGHLLFDGRDLLLVDEDLEIAGMGEIDLRREQGRRDDAVVVARRHRRECDREQGAADAVADRMHLVLADRFLDGVERGERAFAHIVLERSFATGAGRD